MEKFFREKNANSIQNIEKITPKYEELPKFLINKLLEKANQVEIIYDDNKRNEYLARKNKLEKSKGMSKCEVKNFLAKRLSVDILQLYFDLLKVYNINENKNKEIKYINLKEIDYKYKIIEICEQLKLQNNKEIYLDNLFQIIISYISMYNFDLSEIETMRKIVEEKEGNFYNGKVVVYKN